MALHSNCWWLRVRRRIIHVAVLVAPLVQQLGTVAIELEARVVSEQEYENRKRQRQRGQKQIAEEQDGKRKKQRYGEERTPVSAGHHKTARQGSAAPPSMEVVDRGEEDAPIALLQVQERTNLDQPGTLEQHQEVLLPGSTSNSRPGGARAGGSGGTSTAGGPETTPTVTKAAVVPLTASTSSDQMGQGLGPEVRQVAPADAPANPQVRDRAVDDVETPGTADAVKTVNNENEGEPMPKGLTVTSARLTKISGSPEAAGGLPLLGGIFSPAMQPLGGLPVERNININVETLTSAGGGSDSSSSSCNGGSCGGGGDEGKEKKADQDEKTEEKDKEKDSTRRKSSSGSPASSPSPAPVAPETPAARPSPAATPPPPLPAPQPQSLQPVATAPAPGAVDDDDPDRPKGLQGQGSSSSFASASSFLEQLQAQEKETAAWSRNPPGADRDSSTRLTSRPVATPSPSFEESDEDEFAALNRPPPHHDQANDSRAASRSSSLLVSSDHLAATIAPPPPIAIVDEGEAGVVPRRPHSYSFRGAAKANLGPREAAGSRYLQVSSQPLTAFTAVADLVQTKEPQPEPRAPTRIPQKQSGGRERGGKSSGWGPPFVLFDRLMELFG